MAAPLAAALLALGRAVTPPLPFDPARADDRFTFAATDYIEMVLLPRITARVVAAAPRIALDVRPIGEESPLDALAAGTLDGALGGFMQLPPGFHKSALGSERFIGIARRGHPAVGRRPLSIEAWAALGHVLVTPQRTGPAAVDRALQERGLTRHVALYVSHFLVAPLVVAETDLVATLPERAARLLAAQLDLVFFRAADRALRLRAGAALARAHGRERRARVAARRDRQGGPARGKIAQARSVSGRVTRCSSRRSRSSPPSRRCSCR